MQKKSFGKADFRSVVEDVRVEYSPGYDEHNFLGDITRTKNRIEKDGIMTIIFNQKKLGKSYEEISLFLESSNEEYSQILSFEKNIAYEHFVLSGSVPDCSKDVLSPLELDLLGIHIEEKELSFNKSDNSFISTKKKTRKKVMQLHFVLQLPIFAPQ